MMKKLKPIMALSSVVLSVVALAAARPREYMTRAYYQLTDGSGRAAGCFEFTSACIKGNDEPCKDSPSNSAAYSDRYNLNTCNNLFIARDMF